MTSGSDTGSNPLTPEQQALAEQAMRMVPACIKAFYQRLPCIREVAKLCDLESAAYLACCRAARTFDPGRGNKPSAYFSVAIANGMLQEVQREIRSQSHSIRRIRLEAIYSRQEPEEQPREVAIPALLDMSEEERDWIEAFVFDNANFKVWGRKVGRDHRTVRKRLKGHLDRLRRRVEEQP